MNLEIITSFFMWCTIINAVLLLLGFIMCTAAGELVYRIHSRCFPMTRETFNAAIYSLLGVFKIFFLVFNLVPYLALLIIT